MIVLFFSLICSLKSTVDWTSLLIEPALGILSKPEESQLYVFLMNQFEKKPIAQKLTFIVWEFKFGKAESITLGKEAFFEMLERTEKKRYLFETEEAFSGNDFSIENSLAKVPTSITLKENFFLELYFRQDGNLAKLDQIEENYQKLTYASVDETFGPLNINDNDMLEFIKELEEQEKKDEDINKEKEEEEEDEKQKKSNEFILLAIFSSIVILVLAITGSYFYYSFKKRNEYIDLN